MTQPRERVKYAAMVDRPIMKLPGDARVIVWTIVNLEAWEIMTLNFNALPSVISCFYSEINRTDVI